MAFLVLLRHGQSQWNLENRFTGWIDVPLTEQGKADAKKTGKALKDLRFDHAFTSGLVRAQDTLSIILEELDQTNIPIEKDKALNERHYGDLQGLNKAEMAAKYGQEQVKLWRRSYTTRPPNGESHEDCEKRTLPYFLEKILPLLASGKNVLVAAHGNSLRPIIKYLDHMDPEAAAEMEIGLCTPYIYTFEGKKVVKKEMREVLGIVTKASSTTEKRVEKGRV
ncbi:2,3-bisphosphoglycerate-dependent phosphoglycerate mutase [Candidatus Peregrinibacteria bacterium]|nr:2,3-bisphosphoglycerate-dependent phosphoglycerate mutase [Candidatus Peregrinibacteria bacterium]